MQNILLHDVSLESLRECFAASAVVPLLPPLGDEQWQRVAANPLVQPWLRAIGGAALAQLQTPPPELTDALYAEFQSTGNRLRFERLYFERRSRVAYSAIAALTEPDGALRRKFLASTVAKAAEVFAEVSWALPAHVKRDTGKDPREIDLFAAETANLFGELLNVLPEVFPAEFTAAVRARLRSDVFENYLAQPRWWKTCTNNWNAVCHQGVLGAALGLCDDADLLARMFAQAIPGLRIFLGSFPADGGSSEGSGYWQYGFGRFAELNAQLETRTRGQLSLFQNDAHIAAIARYGPLMSLSNGLCVNFSDNNPHASPGPSMLTYLGRRLNDPVILSHAAMAWRRAAATPMDVNAQRGDFFHLSRQLLRCPADLGPVGELPESDAFLPDLGLLLTRFHDQQGRLWEFAAKAGNNEESHNHNDLGSYLLNIDGHRLLTETGAPEYVKDFFSSKETRYKFIAARSLGHPVPLINGQEQPAGKSAFARVSDHQFSPESVTMAIDLTHAYLKEALCTLCRREFVLDKRLGRLEITDTIEWSAAGDVETALITESPVALQDGHAVIRNGLIALRVKPGPRCEFRKVQEHGFNAHDGHPSKLFRIVLVPTVRDRRVVLSCRIEIER